MLERLRELSLASLEKERGERVWSLQLVRESEDTLDTQGETKDSSVRTLKLFPSRMRTFKLYN